MSPRRSTASTLHNGSLSIISQKSALQALHIENCDFWAISRAVKEVDCFDAAQQQQIESHLSKACPTSTSDRDLWILRDFTCHRWDQLSVDAVMVTRQVEFLKSRLYRHSTWSTVAFEKFDVLSSGASSRMFQKSAWQSLYAENFDFWKISRVVEEIDCVDATQRRRVHWILSIVLFIDTINNQLCLLRNLVFRELWFLRNFTCRRGDWLSTLHSGDEISQKLSLRSLCMVEWVPSWFSRSFTCRRGGWECVLQCVAVQHTRRCCTATHVVLHNTTRFVAWQDMLCCTATHMTVLHLQRARRCAMAARQAEFLQSPLHSRFIW